MELVCHPSVWRHPTSGPYVDLTVYLKPARKSLDSLTAATGTVQEPAVRLEFLVYNQEGVVAFDKYVLRRNSLSGEETPAEDWADIRRFYLPSGRYGLEVRAVNLNDTLDKAVLSKELWVDSMQGLPYVSRPLLLHRWSKAGATQARWSRNGYFLMARPEPTFRRSEDTLAFYTEVHRDSLPEGRSVLVYFLQEVQGKGQPLQQGYVRLTDGRPVQAVLGTLPLKEVPEGSYRLILELRDSLNRVMGQTSQSVQRWLPEIADRAWTAWEQPSGGNSAETSSLYAWEQWLTQLDSIRLYRQVSSIRPLCDPTRRTTVDRLLTLRPFEPMPLVSFVVHFWTQTYGAGQAMARWTSYQEEVAKTQALFSSRITPGYETERGRVYLQYGPPNSRTVVDNEPSAYPYEVWWYYQIKGQRNVRFVFYNPDMVTNDYALLHSDAFGENSDPQWRLQLFGRTTAFQDLDRSTNRGHFGSHLDDHLRNQ